ncbi:MAG: DUF192 domain-containing protein [Gammaproteobacteria bacterium]
MLRSKMRYGFILVFMALNVFAAGQSALPTSTLVIGKHRFQVEIATTQEAHQQGLSDRTHLSAHQGMYFVYPDTMVRSFWMKGMQFPLDMIWVREHQVVGIQTDVPKPDPKTPLFELPRYTSPEPVDAVLEVNAGIAEQYGIKVGDKLKILR